MVRNGRFILAARTAVLRIVGRHPDDAASRGPGSRGLNGGCPRQGLRHVLDHSHIDSADDVVQVYAAEDFQTGYLPLRQQGEVDFIGS